MDHVPTQHDEVTRELQSVADSGYGNYIFIVGMKEMLLSNEMVNDLVNCLNILEPIQGLSSFRTTSRA